MAEKYQESRIICVKQVNVSLSVIIPCNNDNCAAWESGILQRLRKSASKKVLSVLTGLGV
jgi:hypothetical protein